MKSIVSIIIFFQIFSFQDRMVELKEYYSGQGVIFDKSEKYPFGELDYKYPLTPSLTYIKKAESILSNDYYDYRTSLMDSLGADKSIIDEKLKLPKNVIKKFYKFNRQYIAYSNTSNDTIITIGLLNFANKRKAEKYFPNWQESIVYGFHGFYLKNQQWLSINVSRNKIVLFTSM